MLPSLLLALPLAGAPTPAADLLDRVPDQAFAIWTCSDVSVALEQIQRNDVVRLLGDGDRSPLRGLLGEVYPGPRRDLDRALELGASLAGQVVAFGTREGLAIVAEAPADRGPLLEQLRALATGLTTTGTEERGGARLEHLGFVREGEAVPLEGGPHVVLVDHPDLVALVQCGAETTAVVDALLAGREEPARAVAGLRRARATHGPAGQAELYVDFSFFAEEARREMQQAGEMWSVDPSRLLGLEETDLYVTASVLPGTSIDLRGHLSIPPGTLLAELADTFRPLPPDLLAAFPEAATGAHAMHWDLVDFYDRLLAALRESEQGQAAEQIEGLVGSSQLMTGVDLEQQLFRQLSGVFALWFLPPAEAAEDPLDDDEIFRGLGVVIDIENGPQMLDTFEALLETVGQGLDFSEEQVESVAVRRWGEFLRGGGMDGGLAFAPRDLLVAFTGRAFDAGLAPLTGGGSALDGTRLRGILDGHRGACYVSALRLRFVRTLLVQQGLQEIPEELEPLFDLYLVDSARRTASGFSFRAGLE